MIDLAPFLATLEAVIEAHAVAPGSYRRWRRDDPGAPRDRAANPYGSADAANLLYTLGRLPGEAAHREAFVAGLRAFQEPATGWFREATHHEIHTTAHCVAALELFEARPLHPLAALARLEAPDALEAFLDGLAWRDDPWLASHRGAGAYAALVLAGEATPAFEDRYFAWLEAEQDPRTGLFRRDCVEPPYRWGTNRFPHLAATFHYLFNVEWARRPLPHAAALVDTCLELFASDEYPLARSVGFAEIDWVYCTTRALARSGHRREEALAALARFAERQAAFLLGLDWEADPGANDLHALFGATCALAELQRALPGTLRSPRPLRLVLDRRPFI